MSRYENSVIARAAPATKAVYARAGELPRPVRSLHGWRAATRIAAFFAVVAVLAFALDRAISSGLRKITTSKYGSLNRVMAGQVNADVVINGSSRALTHYDPRAITQATGLSAYDLGMNGVQIDVQLAMLKAYLNHNRKPRVVVQNLEAFTFEPTRRGEIYDPGLYLPHLSDDEIYRAFLAIDPAVWKWRHIPLYGYAVEDLRFTWAFGLAAHLGYRGREDYIQGFNPRFLSWTEDFDHFRATTGSAGVRYRIEPRGINALIELVTVCQRAGIQVILVYSPEYIEMQNLEVNRAEIFRTFREISARFGVPLWDYSDSAICRERGNFYNSQHLNAQGAAIFSADFAARLAEFQKQRAAAKVSSERPGPETYVNNR